MSFVTSWYCNVLANRAHVNVNILHEIRDGAHVYTDHDAIIVGHKDNEIQPTTYFVDGTRDDIPTIGLFGNDSRKRDITL